MNTQSTIDGAANPVLHRIEQAAGEPRIASVDMKEVDAHRRAIYRGYEAFLRECLAVQDTDRPSQWSRDYSSMDAYERSAEPMRHRLQNMLGFWTSPEHRLGVAEGEHELLVATEAFTARRFFFEVCPGLRSYAVELVPAGAGPHRGLLAQHGYGGCPELVCGLTASANAADYSHRSLGLRAVQQGFHVIAPYHPTGYGSTADVTDHPLPGFEHYSRCYGKNRLHRMAVLAGGTLFGLDMLTTSRAVDVLASRPHVDGNRVGIYGLSQGGMTALFLPALDRRLKASVCSAYFNGRLTKLIGPPGPGSYLDAEEEDKFFSGWIRTFSDDDLVSLIAPRAFAVEAGQQDNSVNFDASWQTYQLAQRHYQRLGIPERIEFIGHAEGHVSATSRAMEFLIEHL